MESSRSFGAAALIVLCALACSARAAVIDVDWSGGGDFTTIQEGLDAAADGDTVLVRAGVYTGSQNLDLGFAANDIVLRSEAGADSTVIDCAFEDHAFDFRAGEGPGARVEGFTVRNGRNSWGGAVHIVGASPAFLRCVFEGCDGTVVGGAVYCEDSSATFEECSFNTNRSPGGGALYCQESPLRIRRCTFLSNAATGSGGAITAGVSAVVVDSCSFEGNEAVDRGGAIWSYSGADTIRRSTFVGNRASDDGGAITCRYSPLVVSDCEFRDNLAEDDGGAVVFWQCEPRMIGCRFEANVAESVGGAILYSEGHGELSDCTFVENEAGHGGAVHLYISSPFVTDCTFLENNASSGGVFYLEFNCAPTFDRCTFAGNVALVDGGGFYIDRSSLTMTACTLAGNAAGDDGGGLRFHISSGVVTNTIIAFSLAGEGAACTGTVAPSFSRCCVFGNAGGDSLCGDYSENVFVNPGFCDPVNGDLTLRSDSVCLPSGNPWGEAIGAHGWGCEGDPYLPEACMVDGAVAPWETAAAIVLEVTGVTEVTVRIYDFTGRLVASPYEADVVPSGVNLLSWDLANDEGDRVASGTYFCVVETGDSVYRRKIAIVGG